MTSDNVAGRRQAEALVRVNQSLDKIAELRPRWMKTPHINGQLQFLQSRHKIRVAIPGNGWGKTTGMGMALDMAIQKDDPYNPDMLPKHAITAIWVCQKFQQMEILRRQLEEDVWTRPWTWNQSRHFYSWPNGGQLHIVSSDSDWQHIQGIPVDYVAFDEHPDRKLWNEFMFRRRGKRKTRYMVAATMTQGLTWFVKEIIQEWEKFHREQGLSAEQARLQQLHRDVWIWDCGGIHDNPAMDAEDIRHYESIDHASDKELKVRLHGGYADFTGESVFPHDKLDEQVENLSAGEDGSLHQCDISASALILPSGIEVESTLRRRLGGRNAQHYMEWFAGGMIDGGRLTVWEKPELGCSYIIGADFAAGLVGRDYDAAIVLKRNEDGTCEQVAEAEGWWGDATFAQVLYNLGVWYFNAFIVGERQFGLATLRRLYDEMHYAYIFRQRMEASRARRPSDLLGHHRSPGDTIIPNLRNAITRDHITLRSPSLMAEMRQYQFRPRNSQVDAEYAKTQDLITSAPPGINDDLVMSLAYAWHGAREVTRFTLPEPDYAPGTYGAVFDNKRVLAGKAPRKPRFA